MNIYFDDKGTLEGLRRSVEKALKDGATGLVIMACEQNNFAPADLAPLVKSVNVPLIGGTFPMVMRDGKTYEKGSVVLGVSGKVQTTTLPDLNTAGMDIETQLKTLSDNSPWARTMVVFVDFFVLRKTDLINTLFEVFGMEISYVGGGAGSLAPERKPCLISNAGMFANGVVVMMLDVPSGVGVGHGWKNIGEPMQVTEAHGNTVKTINFLPAFGVYAEAIEKQSGTPFPRESGKFFEASRAHPFGIARINMEMIVRDPLMVEPDGSLVFAGEVPQDSYISILEGNTDTLITAAGDSSRKAIAALPPGGKPEIFLLMDCISRVMFMSERFKEELDVMVPQGFASAGACTIGEIANSGSEFLEFYNKTAVVAVMGEE